jgi:hypothetical protein
MAYDTASESVPSDSGEMSDEPTMVYLTREQLGGKTYKKGDTISLTVSDVDNESGEVECSIGSGSDQNSSMNDFDQAMQ